MAQRDNRDNLKMAKISTDIASVTKDDSFAMRTIAVMSIIFLPGTFISVYYIIVPCPKSCETKADLAVFLLDEHVQLASLRRYSSHFHTFLNILGRHNPVDFTGPYCMALLAA